MRIQKSVSPAAVAAAARGKQRERWLAQRAKDNQRHGGKEARIHVRATKKAKE
jgi:hypothetical protein